MSNPCVLAVIALKASLDVFETTSMKELCEKSRALTGYLEKLVIEHLGDAVTIITPKDPHQRGCQLSILFNAPGMMQKVFDEMMANKIICDERKPDVIRVAPTPLYNTFEDVWKAVMVMKNALGKN